MTDADSRPATKAELLDVKAELKADIQRLDQKFDKLDQSFGRPLKTVLS